MSISESKIAKAHYCAKKVFVIYPPESFSDSLLLGSLQGLVSNLADEQIMFAAGAFPLYEYTCEKKYGARFIYRDSQGEKWTAASMLSHFASLLDGYIIADCDSENEGNYVAVSVAASLNAVIVTPENEKTAQNAGLKMLLDCRELDDSWLRSSPFWQNINPDLAVEQVITEAPRLVDYAIMAGAYFTYYKGSDEREHREKFAFLNKGAIVFGWNSLLGEYDTVLSFSLQNVCMVPADHAFNLSTLSGFEMSDIPEQKTKKASGDFEKPRHTVCFIMSDGDNLQWLLNGFAMDSSWFASKHRGKFALGWGLPACVSEVAPAMLEYLVGEMKNEEEFIMQLSGEGYTFPSKWDKEELYKMTKSLAARMEQMDTRYAEVLDDKGFTPTTIDAFTCREQIDGVFYIDYWNYAGMKGQLFFSNGKPAVSARYRLWADLPDGQVDHIADAINSASRDPFSPDSYTFVTVHCWSGLDKEGRLVPDGKTVKAVKAVVDKLAKDVNVVTPREFMERIKHCLS